jgi:hypothetical protein
MLISISAAVLVLTNDMHAWMGSLHFVDGGHLNLRCSIFQEASKENGKQ